MNQLYKFLAVDVQAMKVVDLVDRSAQFEGPWLQILVQGSQVLMCNFMHKDNLQQTYAVAELAQTLSLGKIEAWPS
jgi:hypothetical protein